MNLLTSLFLAVCGKVAADEIKDCTSWLPPKLIRWAARRLDGEMPERYEEEWLSHSQDLPGLVPKVVHAIGCVYAALSIHDELRRRVLTIFMRPIFEIFGPVTVLTMLPELLMERRWHDLSPDQIRVRRLNRTSSSIFTLGLSRLWLEPCDLSIALPGSSKTDSPLLDFIEARFPLFTEVSNQHAKKVVHKYLFIAYVLVDRISRLGFSRVDNNELFTKTERATIVQRVAQLKKYVIDNGTVTAYNSPLLEKKIKYLIEASEHCGRKGFLKIVLIVLFWVVENGILTRVQGSDFIRCGLDLFKNLLIRPELV